MTAQTVHMADLQPGDTYATEAGAPVMDAGAPLQVASITPAAPLGGMPAVYVEASNGHGATVRMDARTRIVAPALTWDEPPGATSPRGWLRREGMPIAFYLDYGPDHYRTGHVTEVGPGHYVSFCAPGHKCRECEPGNILCVRYPAGPRDHSAGRSSRYVETIAQARTYCETGTVTPAELVTRAA